MIFLQRILEFNSFSTFSLLLCSEGVKDYVQNNLGMYISA